MVGLGGVGPAPRIGESVELCLAHLPAGFAEEDVVIGVRIERWVEINQVDAVFLHQLGQLAAGLVQLAKLGPREGAVAAGQRDLEDGRCVLWNKAGRHDVAEAVGGSATVEAFRDDEGGDDWVVCVLRKR